MNVDEIVAAAIEQTALDDLGEDLIPSSVLSFREGLELYVDSLDREAQLNELGAVALPAAVTAALVNRLKVVDWAKQHPEVQAERIEAPVVVIGMFRAGTTFLSHLLDQDPANRALLAWESQDSAPPPTRELRRSGPRVDAAQGGVDMLEMLNPAISAIHHETAVDPTECIAVMGQAFQSISWEAIANVPSYGAWWREADDRPAYDYHRLVLLHRDPVALVGSVCSLIRVMSSTFSDADHRAYIAEHWQDTLEESVRRIDDFRARRPEHPILDVAYADLARDPLGSLMALYDGIGLEPGIGAFAAVERYLVEHPRREFGSHTYDVSEFGLTEAGIRRRFRGYSARYGVEPETLAN
jgi:hypothetical protein